jgi:hypothetical protein
MEEPGAWGTRSRNSGPHPGAGAPDQTSLKAVTIRSRMELSCDVASALGWTPIRDWVT